MPTLVENRPVKFNYEILEKFEAGLELLGYEVKALRASKASLAGSHIGIEAGQAYLIGATISPYQVGNTPADYDAKRPRRLLLKKQEIAQLAGAESKSGLTIVPLSVYTSGRKIKLAVGVVRGRKRFDKRQVIKKRESDREMRRELKRE